MDILAEFFKAGPSVNFKRKGIIKIKFVKFLIKIKGLFLAKRKKLDLRKLKEYLLQNLNFTIDFNRN